jgi:hypothetical protein
MAKIYKNHLQPRESALFCRDMKNTTLSAALLLALNSCASWADEKPVVPTPAPAYVSEAPLPEGWPAPGPYDKVSTKTMPGYRAAFTTKSAQTMAFWTLFTHIKKNDIPMTSPVEMAMETEESSLEMASMGFLYQNGKVGTAGAAGKNVEVRDVPSQEVLSYTWQGDDTKENVAKAKTAIDAAIAEKKLTLERYRLLGYNGPATPRNKATWELQAILKK